MIGAISNNGLLAALFGTGTTRAPAVRGGTGADRSPQGSRDPFSPRVSSTTYPQPVDTVELSSARAGAASSSIGTAPELSPDEQKQVRELKQRDAEVRRHEQAHKAAAGGNAKGGASFEYQTGPDGKRYAVGGEVSIDTSEVAGDPQATIRKMQQIQRAANAPAEPSSQDRAVAAQARATEQKARAEQTKQRREASSGTTNNASPNAVGLPQTAASQGASAQASSPQAATPQAATPQAGALRGGSSDQATPAQDRRFARSGAKPVLDIVA